MDGQEELGAMKLRRDLDMRPIVLQLARGRKVTAPGDEKPYPRRAGAEGSPEDRNRVGSTLATTHPGRGHGGLPDRPRNPG